MPGSRSPASAAPALLTVLGILLVLSVLAGGAWKLNRDQRTGQSDLKRELQIRADAALIGQFHQKHGYLPRRLVEVMPSDPHMDAIHGPEGYRRLDADHFQLGMRFAAVSSHVRGRTLGPAWRHPAGYAWFTFDVHKLEDPASAWAADPDAVEPASDQG